MKKQKICITGSLGYLGTALTELLSGEARYKDIVCIDNRFLSERVTQLRSWGMQFVQGSILDKELMQLHLHDADVVYHLAGITDVAYTATQSDPEKDSLIAVTGIEGTANIVNVISASCKLIFPSTHVVFEGLTETTFDITENAITHPILTYACGKDSSEQSLQAVHTNHIIVRLGSVYGYSGDTMRINIMPNLFSKIASQNGTINLFGGGIQYKSLVNVTDVVRAMKYLAEGDYTGTYHLSNENMTVREVADICKVVNPLVTLTETDDEIPNKGYTLSNAKLLSTGFKFLYNIQDSIRDMITKWSYRNTDTELEYIQKGGNEYIDKRGVIRNYELTEPINLIGWIESKAGTVRANHYHPIQEQKCLLISGRYVSVTKDLSYSDASIEYKVINPGDIAVIRPNVAHTMVFLQDSKFLNLVRGEREHDNYGITHTIPYILVDENHKQHILADIASIYKNNCRVCGGTDLTQVVDLGLSPLANNLLDSPDQHCDMYPLELMYCPHCCNVQLSVVVPASKMFDNYLYVSSTSPVFRKHFEEAAEQYISEFNLSGRSVVYDIGSNDGVFLKPLQERGIRVCGIEPAANLAELANTKGIPTIHGYFNSETGHQAYERFGSPTIITASNVFAHADGLADITRIAFTLLVPDGVFIIEIQYLMDTIRDMTFDNIYHEHVNYWSVTALANFFDLLGLYLYKVEHINTHGGSIRCYISKARRDDSTVQEYLIEERKQGIYKSATFREFGNRISAIRTQVKANMQLLKQKFPNICAYGSPAKATTALNYFGITGKDIMYTIEDNTLKNAKWIPGVKIPIWEQDDIYKIPEFPDVCIVLAWNFYQPIAEKLSKLHIPSISIKDLEKATDDIPLLDTETPTGTPITGKVYDCFLFFNELDLLELRLGVLDSVVDYFVIVEANITHSGEPKDFILEQNQSRFANFWNRIIYVKVDDIPNDFTALSQLIASVELTYSGYCWNRIVSSVTSTDIVNLENLPGCREQWQRASIIRGLEHAEADDIIMLSDIDEITNPDTLSYLLHNFDPSHVYGMRMNSYYYYLNLLKEPHWVGARIATFKLFSTYTPISFRHIRDVILAKGGWHFSFQGTRDQVAAKLQAYSHSDMVTEETLDKLQERIHTITDPFNRSVLTPVPIDNTYPQYLLDHINDFRHMIL